MDRRASSPLRVPFVRRCLLDFGDGVGQEAFIVNINVSGAYVAKDELPTLGQWVICRFGLPDSEREISVEGNVVWVNPRQQHPVHSLPPGFGLKFLRLSSESRQTIERLVVTYLAGRPRPQ